MKNIVLTVLLTAPASVFADQMETVRAFVDAFNRQDTGAMISFVTADTRWMFVSDDKLVIETSSRDQLEAMMQQYLSGPSQTRSELVSIAESGPFVHTVEAAYWIDEGVERSQCSVAVYQFDAAKISNVWYFDAHECD